MAYSLSLRPEAEEDIREAYSYYQQCRVGLGNDFLESIENAFEKILANPKIYCETHNSLRRLFIKRFPFGIFYKIIGDSILVIAVIHTSRDPDLWQQRS